MKFVAHATLLICLLMETHLCSGAELRRIENVHTLELLTLQSPAHAPAPQDMELEEQQTLLQPVELTNHNNKHRSEERGMWHIVRARLCVCYADSTDCTPVNDIGYW